ncbi:MAG: hypothetical protein R3281_14615 [Balneolaceae bacterium]|nr:hypothetical protein [Balneolaceae bacterium]
MKPPAITIAYGLAFGTTITLIILPCLLYINGNIRARVFGFIRNHPVKPLEVEPTRLLMKHEIQN